MPPNPTMPAPALLTLPLLLAMSCVEYGIKDEDDQSRAELVVEEEFLQRPQAAVDVLWVIDDTGSMADEQEALGQGFSSFMDALEDASIDWQVAVTTTDITREDAGTLRGLPWIITPATDGAEEAFADAVSVGVSGAPPEAGLGAAVLALSEPNRSTLNRGFRRDGAVLHVVVVSDDDDSSEDVLGSDPTGAFLAFLAQERTQSGADVFFSAMAGDIPHGCNSADGRAQPGYRYLEVVEAASGVFASICSLDFPGVLEAIASSSIVLPRVFQLQASPKDESVTVWVDGERSMEGFWVEDSALVFLEPPPADVIIRVRYTIFEEGS